jgi:hypothetical protein
VAACLPNARQTLCKHGDAAPAAVARPKESLSGKRRTKKQLCGLVLNGLKENTKVVMNPSDDLDEGIEVQVKPVEKPKPAGTVAQSASNR